MIEASAWDKRPRSRSRGGAGGVRRAWRLVGVLSPSPTVRWTSTARRAKSSASAGSVPVVVGDLSSSLQLSCSFALRIRPPRAVGFCMRLAKSR